MKSEYFNRLEYAIDKGNGPKAVAVIQQALEKDIDDEQLCANLIIIGYTFGLPCFEFIQKFLGHYPNSLYPIRVILAKILCESDNYDDATSEARYFLRVVQDRDLLNQIEDEKLLEYTMQAFLLTISIYVFVGARSYARRVIEWAKELAPDAWQENFDKELANLVEELKEEKLKEIDDKWEGFFNNYDNYEELYQKAAENRFTELAIRMRLLRQERMEDETKIIDRSEILRIVMVDDKGEYLLG